MQIKEDYCQYRETQDCTAWVYNGKTLENTDPFSTAVSIPSSLGAQFGFSSDLAYGSQTWWGDSGRPE